MRKLDSLICPHEKIKVTLISFKSTLYFDYDLDWNSRPTTSPS